MSDTYAGDITPKEAWTILEENPGAVLIDVRTQAEWDWIGQVDLSGLGKKHGCVEWIHYPGGLQNEQFVDQIKAVATDPALPVLLLCRSGVRSKHAAIVMTAAGYQTCYNIAGGFEGDKDENGHRATVNGWKVASLPWIGG